MDEGSAVVKLWVRGRRVRVLRLQEDADVVWVYGPTDVLAWPVAGHEIAITNQHQWRFPIGEEGSCDRVIFGFSDTYFYVSVRLWRRWRMLRSWPWTTTKAQASPVPGP